MAQLRRLGRTFLRLAERERAEYCAAVARDGTLSESAVYHLGLHIAWIEAAQMVAREVRRGET